MKVRDFLATEFFLGRLLPSYVGNYTLAKKYFLQNILNQRRAANQSR